VARVFGRTVAHQRRARLKPRGFTLIELLIAVAVFAVVAIAVYTRSGDTLQQLGGLEERTVALWLAENELAAMRLARNNTDQPMPTGKDTRQVTMAGRDWLITTRMTDTSHPWLRRADVSVASAQRPDHSITSLTGFIGRY
jgi:general secretion pathway protein I